MRKNISKLSLSIALYGRMDDATAPPFNTVSVISGQWDGDNERLCAILFMEGYVQWKEKRKAMIRN